MSEQLREVLLKLEVANDNHWTGDGLPRLETVKMLSGDQSVTREIISNALPGFSRATQAPKAEPKVLMPAVTEELERRQEEALKAESAKLDELRVNKDKAAKAFAEQLKVVDTLIVKEEAEKPAESPIRGYLDRQVQNLEDRGRRLHTIREAGVDFKELMKNLKSPIDQSLNNRKR